MTGLVGWWPLNESTGVTRDLSGNSNDGNVVGAAQEFGYAPGGLTAYRLDGVDDYINVGQVLSSNITTFTFVAWGRLNTNSPNTPFNVLGMGVNDGVGGFAYEVFEDSGTWSGRVAVKNNDGSTDALPENPVNSWHMYSVVVDDGNITKYQDDTSYGAPGSATDIGDASFAQFIGADYSGTTGTKAFWEGEMTGVRLYDRALSANEIQALYDWGAGDYARPPDNSEGGVGWWSFDDDATDQWGSNDGTVNGATFVPDSGPRRDGGYSFDGVDDHISLGSSAILGEVSELTLSMWAYITDVSNDHGLFAFGYDGNFDSWVQYIDGTDSIRFGLTNTSNTRVFFDSDAGLDINTWNLVTCTYDGATMRVYVDAVQDPVTASLSGNIDESTSEKVIGDKPDQANAWTGELADVRLYNRALTPAEISQIYRYGTLGIDKRQKLVEAR